MKTAGNIQVTPLGKGFYVLLFSYEEDYLKALAGGPWFLFDYYLAVQRWKPGFDPTQDKMQNIVLWVQLPELPVKLYHPKALHKIGCVLGKPIKLDSNTASGNRGRYARICIDVDIGNPLVPKIQVGNRIQPVVYELQGAFCYDCPCSNKLWKTELNPGSTYDFGRSTSKAEQGSRCT